jgi:succinate dehydrogenase flavin-adding protein (antitoxin of CptAB toxin-antitoxin module)
MAGLMGFNEIDRTNIDFWEKEWRELTETQKDYFCNLIGLKSRAMEGEFLALMAFQTYRKDLGIIKNII